MALPEGWEWLDDLPEEWIPPADLQEPTRSVKLNLPIKILSSQIIGNDLIELVGLMIAETARFSMWFATEAKAKASSNKELAVLSLFSHEKTRHVYEAWMRYAAAFQATDGLVGGFDDEETALRDALSHAISELSAVRQKFDV